MMVVYIRLLLYNTSDYMDYHITYCRLYKVEMLEPLFWIRHYDSRLLRLRTKFCDAE